MKTKFRKPILEQYRKVYLTKESHSKLRRLKTKQKKSMAQIVLDLIAKEHKRVFKI